MITAKKGETKVPDTSLSMSKKVYLASLGLVVVLREESTRLFDHLVARGAPLEKPVRERAAAVKKEVDKDLKRTREAVGRTLGKAFGRYAAPEKDELAGLAEQVDRLGDRIEKLSN